jgi:hypothetical protein
LVRISVVMALAPILFRLFLKPNDSSRNAE